MESIETEHHENSSKLTSCYEKIFINSYSSFNFPSTSEAQRESLYQNYFSINHPTSWTRINYLLELSSLFSWKAFVKRASRLLRLIREIRAKSKAHRLFYLFTRRRRVVENQSTTRPESVTDRRSYCLSKQCWWPQIIWGNEIDHNVLINELAFSLKLCFSRADRGRVDFFHEIFRNVLFHFRNSLVLHSFFALLRSHCANNRNHARVH